MTTSRHLAAVPDQPRRAVFYVRVSALMGRSGDDFHSPEVQAGAIRRATPGLREVETVEDIDVSGTTFSRKGLDRIRKLVEARQVDVIAVYDLSRLGRNVLESLQFLKWIAERGVTIVSACEQIDTSTPAGEMMLINMLNLAQYRSREIGRGWQQIIRRRAERGQHHGRPATGYRRRDDGRLEPDPVLGPAMTRLFEDYADGVAHREVRRRFQAATGRPVSATGMKRMLTNITYRGVVRLRDGAQMEGAHDPLVGEATWRRVQRRVEEARWMPARYQSPRYSISGLGRCGRCDGATTIRADSRGTTRVYCNHTPDTASPCPGCGGLPLADVEATILDQIRQYAAELRGDVAAQQARRARATRAGVDRTTLERELTDTRRAMVRLTTRWARTQDDPVYEESMVELRAEEQRLQDRIGQAEDVSTGPPPEQVVGLADELVRLWPDMDGSQRNRALRELVDGVVVRPGTRYRQPASERVEALWR